MRQPEEMPLDPEVLAELEAIDATLAGDAVDPAHAEIAELALLLADGRRTPSAQFIRVLDARAAQRFVAAPSAVRAASAAAPGARRPAWRRARRRPSRRLLAATAAGALAAATAAVVIGSGSLSTRGSQQAPIKSPQVTSAESAPAASGNSALSSLSQNLTATAPAPVSGSGGREIQSAQLQLTAANAHIDAVAQEVFNVVSLEGGAVEHSQVTAAARGDGGSYASFTLSVPTANLEATMARMSGLRYATVASRTDGTENVSGQYQTDQRRIADQEAVRSALLKQLQSAETQAAIDSIQAQLKLAESQLSTDQAALRSLQDQISHSSIDVQVNASAVVVPVGAAGHGFTIGRGAHDSVRVLVVAAGVALIACAALIPVGLLAALGAWIAFWLRRRRRQALDAA